MVMVKVVAVVMAVVMVTEMILSIGGVAAMGCFWP